MLRLVADENIPLARAAFGGLGELRLLPGHAITPAVVRHADVLLVRSVTRVDANLIAGSRLRFVGSATIGTDHVDQVALAAAGIPFHYAPGSNAESVVEYVLAALLALAAHRGAPLRGRTAGIIGCGRIGGELAVRLEALGMRVLRNDPPLAREAERTSAPHQYVALPRLLDECDVITLHVPLTPTGAHPTLHLLDAPALTRLHPNAWLVNTSRGAVVDGAALLQALVRQAIGAAVLDVWEQEPAPDPALIAHCAIATPHIAGYSWDGKVAGTIMLHGALVRTLGLASSWQAADALDADSEGTLDTPMPPAPADADAEARWLYALVRQMYDVKADDARMRAIAGLDAGARGRAFHALRREYPRRRTFRRYTLLQSGMLAPQWREAVTAGLGVTLI